MERFSSIVFPKPKWRARRKKEHAFLCLSHTLHCKAPSPSSAGRLLFLDHPKLLAKAIRGL
uniref:Uncharacterized protein n=1 Tax=Leersia perrieri TaxID=77586 RepID=A0A0D9WKH8_9ORYZ